MSDDKRMIQNYEVKNAIHIGGTEIIYAEDFTASEPYMVCNCQWGNPLSFDIYDKAVAGTDYLEAMTEFLNRASTEIQHIKEQRIERDVSDQPLATSDCLPDSRSAHYENQLVVIKPERMIASARTADHQLLLATGGNGCNPDARGQAVFCKNLFTGKTERWERFDIAGIIQPERIPEWAHQQLAKMGISIEKSEPPKVYMASVDEARKSGEIEAYWKSRDINQACAISIQGAINDSYKGNYSYDLPAALKAVTEKYGAERVNVVLANTISYKDYDGRFSHDNKQWAKNIQLPDMPRDRLSDFVCEAHPAILDGFINHARKAQQEKKPSIIEHLNKPVKPPKPKKKDPPHAEQGR